MNVIQFEMKSRIDVSLLKDPEVPLASLPISAERDIVLLEENRCSNNSLGLPVSRRQVHNQKAFSSWLEPAPWELAKKQDEVKLNFLKLKWLKENLCNGLFPPNDVLKDFENETWYKDYFVKVYAGEKIMPCQKGWSSFGDLKMFNGVKLSNSPHFLFEMEGRLAVFRLKTSMAQEDHQYLQLINSAIDDPSVYINMFFETQLTKYLTSTSESYEEESYIIFCVCEDQFPNFKYLSFRSYRNLQAKKCIFRIVPKVDFPRTLTNLKLFSYGAMNHLPEARVNSLLSEQKAAYNTGVSVGHFFECLQYCSDLDVRHLIFVFMRTGSFFNSEKHLNLDVIRSHFTSHRELSLVNPAGTHKSNDELLALNVSKTINTSRTLQNQNQPNNRGLIRVAKDLFNPTVTKKRKSEDEACEMNGNLLPILSVRNAKLQYSRNAGTARSEKKEAKKSACINDPGKLDTFKTTLCGSSNVHIFSVQEVCSKSAPVEEVNLVNIPGTCNPSSSKEKYVTLPLTSNNSDRKIVMPLRNNVTSKNIKLESSPTLKNKSDSRQYLKHNGINKSEEVILFDNGVELSYSAVCVPPTCSKIPTKRVLNDGYCSSFSTHRFTDKYYNEKVSYCDTTPSIINLHENFSRSIPSKIPSQDCTSQSPLLSKDGIQLKFLGCKSRKNMLNREFRLDKPFDWIPQKLRNNRVLLKALSTFKSEKSVSMFPNSKSPDDCLNTGNLSIEHDYARAPFLENEDKCKFKNAPVFSSKSNNISNYREGIIFPLKVENTLPVIESCPYNITEHTELNTVSISTSTLDPCDKLFKAIVKLRRLNRSVLDKAKKTFVRVRPSRAVKKPKFLASYEIFN